MSGRPGHRSIPLPLLGEPVSRRSFMKAAGVAAAAAGLDGCWQPPDERILPYAEQPPEVVPGVPIAYATASVVDGHATGLLVQTREGRPIKVEGNPSHPASLGATGAWDQALLADLYDASRLAGIRARGGPAPRSQVLERVRPSPSTDGSGLALLLEPTSSPLRARLLERIEERWPGIRVYFHAPVGPSRSLEAFERGAGRPLAVRYDLSAARTVVALDADFVSGAMPGSLRYARQFAAGRTPVDPAADMSRLYVAEPVPSCVAPVADHAVRVRGGDIVFLLGALVRALGGRADGLPSAPDRLDSERVRAWVHSAVADLRARPGEGVVIVGEHQPPAAHLLAHEANRVIGSLGRTVRLQEPALIRPDRIRGGAARLADAIRGGEVDRLVVLEGDPAWTAPADVELGDAMAGLADVLHLSLRENATARIASAVLPARHLFESWGDARAFDGTLTPVQPLLRPLVEGALSPDGLLLALLGEPTSSYDALRADWRRTQGGTGDDEAWESWWSDALRRGLVDGTAYAEVAPPAISAAAVLAETPAPPSERIEVAFAPDACLYDGRFAANAWLQELPDPATKLSWCNGAMMSPAQAARLGVGLGDPVLVDVDGRRVEAPAIPVAGHVDRAVTITLGQGQDPPPTRHRPLGVDAYRLRTSGALWHAAGTVEATGGERWPLPDAQMEKRMHDRPIVLHHGLDEWAADPDFTATHRGEQPTWYRTPEVPAAERQWGMAIDLSICTGCSACVVACRAENNIPVVGPEQVRKGRLMDWLRIDAYVTGDENEPDGHLRQPMLCQHCEDAPCEYVCPVYATVHSDDGLNEMIYNRCVGTRFCSNNCPYKVRRFNWLDYNEMREPVEELQLNPDVTVRGRGVMEKCTYCVQRIRRTQIRARVEGREPGPNEVVTACQQACPTRAIVFGDIANAESDVARLRESPRRYDVLFELGTRPRTQYLAHITNPSADFDLDGEGDA